MCVLPRRPNATETRANKIKLHTEYIQKTYFLHNSQRLDPLSSKLDDIIDDKKVTAFVVVPGLSNSVLGWRIMVSICYKAF